MFVEFAEKKATSHEVFVDLADNLKNGHREAIGQNEYFKRWNSYGS